MSSHTNSSASASFTGSTQNIFATFANDTTSIDTDLNMAGNDSSASLHEITNSSAQSDLSSGISIIDFAYVNNNNINRNYPATKLARDRRNDFDEQPAHKFKKLDYTRKARITAYVRKHSRDMSGGTNHQVLKLHSPSNSIVDQLLTLTSQIEWTDEEEEKFIKYGMVPFEQLADKDKAAAAKARFERKELTLDTNLDATFKGCTLKPPISQGLDSGIELNDSSDGNSSSIEPPSTPPPTGASRASRASAFAAAQQAPKHTNLSVEQRDMSRAYASGVATTMRFPCSLDDFASDEDFEGSYTLTRVSGRGALHAFNERFEAHGGMPRSFDGGHAGSDDEGEEEDPFGNEDDIRMW